MNRFVDCNEKVDLCDIERIQSLFELISWRKKSSTSPTIQYHDKNQNAISHHHHSQNENISTSNPSLPSTNFTTDNPVELRININNKPSQTDSHSSPTITRCSSKPSRHESVQTTTTTTTSQTRKHRYINYRYRLQENQLYSLIVSSNGIECYGTNCQPSIFNVSHRCRIISSSNDIDSFKKLSLMNDQDIKQNMSYISLTNLSNLIDHEPNVSRRDSYSRSTSNILMHKPSLFLADIFNKMTHEQRTKSIAQLVQLHENLTKSDTSMNKLQRTTSLPNFNNKLMQLHSVTSLLSSEKTTANISQNDIETSNDKCMPTDLNEITTWIVINPKVQTSEHLSPSSTLSEQKLSHENIHTDVPSPSNLAISSSRVHSPMIKSSSILIKSNKSNTSTENENIKISRSNNFLNDDLNEQSSRLKLKSINTSKIEEINSQLSNNEIENSLNDVTDHLSQQDITISNTNLDESVIIPSKEFNKVKQILPVLKTIDEVSQYSNSSHSDLKNSTLLNTGNETLYMSTTKSQSIPLSPVNDVDTSMITRIVTASTNLTVADDDDDDDQSKLINEQIKRSSLGLARDSLELIRNATPHHPSNEEQLIPHTNIIDSTPQPRKSVLKSHLDSSDTLPTPDLISYVAIDEVKGDKHLLEQQMRRRSLTLGNGGGTVISCISPKPKRDSLTLLQERYSGLTTPHSGCYHLSGPESKHVEFIREPGDTITPVFHIGRGIKLKHPLNKPLSPSSSSDHFHYQFANHIIDSSERTKSDTSIKNTQPHPSLDNMSRHRTSQTLLPSKTTSFVHTNNIEQEKIYFNKNDYDEIIRLMMIPLSNTKKKYSNESRLDSNIELSINHRLTTLQNLILVILLISFYIFVFIKSQYWQEHNQS